MTTPSPTDSEAQQESLSTHNFDMHQQEDPQENTLFDSQAPQTLTLESHHTQLSDQPQSPHDPQNHPIPLEFEKNHDDPEGIYAQSHQTSDLHLNPAVSASVNLFIYQRGTNKKKKGQKRRPAEEKKLMQKLEVLNQNIKPFPFVPSKNLDFPSHQTLLERLGLWEFVNIQFDRNIRSDLLVQLIAMFSSNQRCSYVNGLRVKVNRADLARALKLQVRKTPLPDGDEDLPVSAESIGFMLDFVDNWVLLHDDTWMMPESVLKWIQTIKDGNFEKVDWASMIWFMVEKELFKEQHLTSCYYASHLQCLIRSQHGVLFGSSSSGEEPQIRGNGDMKMEEQEEEEEEHNRDVKWEGNDDSQSRRVESEEHLIELSLGQDKVVENINEEDEKEQFENACMMDGEDYKEDESAQLFMEEKNTTSELFLQRCNLGEHKVLDFDDDEQREDKEEGVGEEGNEKEGREEGNVEDRLLEMEGRDEEDDGDGDGDGDGDDDDGDDDDDRVEELGEEYEGGFHLFPNGIPVEGLSSGNLNHPMESAQMPLESGMAFHDPLAGDFLASRDDTRMHLGGSFNFGNGIKREISHESDDTYHSLNDNKRLRMDGPWNSKDSEFDVCMEQIQHCMAKAKMVFAAKEQICDETTMSQQFLLSQLQEREGVITELQKAKMEEQQKRHIEMYKLEREMCVMENLLEGYRKALKETHKAFAEYRARCPQPDDEPLYKDVAGSGGLVLTTAEVAKQLLKLEEEKRLNRLLIEKKVEDFEMWWDRKFKDHHQCVETLADKLESLDGDIKLLKPSFANHRVSEATESVRNDS